MAPKAFILPSEQIIADEWNACIAKSANGLIYSSTQYLDAMTDNWHGVVIDNYRAVMAIPWRMKFGVRYAYAPALVQQLGLVGGFTEPDLKAIVRTLPDFVRFADIHFNFSNAAIATLQGVTAKTNFVIDLAAGYENIYASYRKDLKENIRRMPGHELVFGEGTIEEAIGLYHHHYSNRIENAGPETYRQFLELCHSLAAQQQCMVKYIAHKEDILAIALLLNDGRRIYNLMNTTTAKGRSLNANDLLIDSILKTFSGQPLLFDFEGSELPGVKEYYQKFGAVNQPYFHYRYNGLPWPLRLFKR